MHVLFQTKVTPISYQNTWGHLLSPRSHSLQPCSPKTISSLQNIAYFKETQDIKKE